MQNELEHREEHLGQDLCGWSCNPCYWEDDGRLIISSQNRARLGSLEAQSWKVRSARSSKKYARLSYNCNASQTCCNSGVKLKKAGYREISCLLTNSLPDKDTLCSGIFNTDLNLIICLNWAGRFICQHVEWLQIELEREYVDWLYSLYLNIARLLEKKVLVPVKNIKSTLTSVQFISGIRSYELIAGIEAWIFLRSLAVLLAWRAHLLNIIFLLC